MKKYWTIAHRGFKSKDNSKIAIQNAIKANFDVIEIDIQHTLDKRLILHHDLFLNDHYVEQTPLHVLQEIDPEIITIEHFFEIIQSSTPEKKIEILLDLKGSHQIPHLLLSFLKTLNPSYLNQVLISSFQSQHLDIIIQDKIRVAGVGIALCNDFLPLEIVPNIEFVSVDINILSPKLMKTIRDHNLVIFVFTCKSDHERQYITNYDVDGIISDILL